MAEDHIQAGAPHKGLVALGDAVGESCKGAALRSSLIAGDMALLRGREDQGQLALGSEFRVLEFSHPQSPRSQCPPCVPSPLLA